MRTALAAFDQSLTRVRKLADRIAQEAPAAMTDRALLELHETQQCGATVLLSGYFEAFLKDCVRAFVQSVSRSGTPFTSLPSTMRDRHYEAGGKVLTLASETMRNGRSSPFGPLAREDVAMRLHSVASAHGSYDILWEAFADTRANPSAAVVREIAQTLGASNVWPEISRGCGVPDTRLIAILEDLIRKRNECAHTGQVSPIPTSTELKQFADTLRDIATGLVVVLEAERRKY